MRLWLLFKVREVVKVKAAILLRGVCGDDDHLPSLLLGPIMHLLEWFCLEYAAGEVFQEKVQWSICQAMPLIRNPPMLYV